MLTKIIIGGKYGILTVDAATTEKDYRGRTLPLTVCSPAVHYPAAVCSESTGRSWAAVKNGLAGRLSRRRNVLPNG